jgi:hypothetical protein
MNEVVLPIEKDLKSDSLKNDSGVGSKMNFQSSEDIAPTEGCVNSGRSTS